MVPCIFIFSDHKNIEYLHWGKRLKPQQAVWALFFSCFNFHITYRPGAQNHRVDALSRMYPAADVLVETILHSISCYYTLN